MSGASTSTNMQKTHTKGPWEFERVSSHINGPSYDVFVKETRRNWDHLHETSVYTVATVDGDRPGDARLIAAAPELLEAAKEAGSVLMAALDTLKDSGWADDYPQAFKARQETVAKLRAAIQKGEGR